MLKYKSKPEYELTLCRDCQPELAAERGYCIRNRKRTGVAINGPNQGSVQFHACER